jgi:hypothetical protein
MDGKATRKKQESNLQTMTGIRARVTMDGATALIPKTQSKVHLTSHATEGLRKIGAIVALIMI